jgi:hypothetical protein
LPLTSVRTYDWDRVRCADATERRDLSLRVIYVNRIRIT